MFLGYADLNRDAPPTKIRTRRLLSPASKASLENIVEASLKLEPNAAEESYDAKRTLIAMKLLGFRTSV